MGENVEGAFGVDFEGEGELPRLALRLGFEAVLKVQEGREVVPVESVVQVVPVDDEDNAVDDRVLGRGQAVAAPDDGLAQREDEIGFEDDRVVVIAVVFVHVEGV